MKVGDIGRSMRDRMPWSVGQKILAELDLGRGQGWDKTVTKLDELDLTEKQFAELSQSLREHLLCGEKSVRIYDVKEDISLTAIAQAHSWEIEETDFSKRYPILLSEEELFDKSLDPVLTAVEDNDEFLSVIFSSVRIITIRETITHDSEYADDLEKIFGRFDQVIGLKNRRVHAVDVVSISKSGGQADVRIDCPYGMTSEAADIAHVVIREAINKLIGFDFLVEPVNLFPLLDKMYFDQAEGKVVELAFGTTTASIKHEKMRRKGLSLREEAYHIGGKENLGTPIEPFRLSLIWERQIGDRRVSSPELNLHTSARIANMEAPHMHSAVVRKCMGADDFDFVMSRIRAHLKSDG